MRPLRLLAMHNLSNLLTSIGMKTDEQKQFTVFSDVFANNTTENKKYDCLDQNVNFYNTYNYTLYAPKTLAPGIPIPYPKGMVPPIPHKPG